MNYELTSIKTIFFDFDGVIADSVDIKTRAFAKLFERYGEDVVKKVVEYHLSHGGVSRYDKFRYYYQNILSKKITDDEIDILDKKFSEIVFNEVLKAPLIEGVVDFLNFCLRQEKKMFVVSATPQKEIRKIVEGKGLSKYFQDVVGSPAKKDESVGYLIRKYGLKPERSLYFGDSAGDLKASQKYKIKFVPINYFDGSKGFKDFREFMSSVRII